MAQYCKLCGQVTNCTEDCVECLKEEEQTKELYEDLYLEQTEQM